jgi:hypothetical protein
VTTIQRVRVRWSAAARGAPQANLRRGLDSPVPLPPLPAGSEIVIHDVLADEADRYERRSEVLAGGPEIAREIGLGLNTDGHLRVDRLPGSEAYPRREQVKRLFTLAPGETGRYRANFRFRFTTCACAPYWFYESWLVLVANGPTRTAPAYDVDHRTHLYGG